MHVFASSCSPVSSNLPSHCRALQDPDNKCCQKVFCDTINPTPIFPVTDSFTGQSGYCNYKGAFYAQGQTWTEGCSKQCQCENVTTGYYSCKDRCPTFNNLPPHCKLVIDSNDPCCVVPDCNVLPTVSPLPGKVPQPVYTITPAPPGTYTAVGHGSPGMCIYKGKTYSTNDLWEDGCDFHCKCIDAQRGQYQCTDRCSHWYGPISQTCYKIPDPNDPTCCKSVKCDERINVTTTTTTTTASPVTTSSCTYTDGRQFSQDSLWNDGCAGQCKCVDASVNKYVCSPRCVIYNSLPSQCTLTPDTNDQCCMQPTCTGQYKPYIGGSGPQTPVPANVTDIFPLGTHSSITGRGGFSGGRGKFTFPKTILVEFHQRKATSFSVMNILHGHSNTCHYLRKCVSVFQSGRKKIQKQH